MKKNYLWGICAVMALSSCSQDEVVSVPQTGISYSVVTDKASRAEAVFCNENLPDHFYVSAELQGSPAKTYFTEDLVTVTTSNSTTTCTQTNSRYWPETGSLGFYAYANGNKGTAENATVTFSLTDKKITGYEVGTTVAEQKDLIYAVKTNQSKPTSKATKVSLNFRHALSQIVFQAWNKNPNIYVEISGVEVHNVANKGDFTFPTTNTETNITDHDQNGSGTNTPTQITPQGTWNLTSGSTADYAITFNTPIAVAYNETTKVNLTNNQIYNSNADTDTNEGSDFSKAMLLLPQGTTDAPVAAWTKPTTDWTWSVSALRNTTEGAFFFVKCKIWNVAGTEYAPSTDVLVYSNNDAAKEILIPVEIVWNQGYKYVYTFIFDTTGDGGIDPEDGDPVLIPITYEISVDDFINETETEVDMDSESVLK